jgi:phosphoribosyl 1,2-cyclic phosphodiesterase
VLILFNIRGVEVIAMKIIPTGTRGSIPSPSGEVFGDYFETGKYGGNTTCVYMEGDDGSKHILDAGTGIRTLGLYLAKQKKLLGKPVEANLYISHTHWDHIQGLPFFIPAYDPSNIIRVYGEARLKENISTAVEKGSRIFQVTGDFIKHSLEVQQQPDNFPVPLTVLKGIKTVSGFISGSEINSYSDSIKVETLPLNHPGGCVSYKFTEIKDGIKKIFVYSTDFEPDRNGADDMLIKWWANADLVIADGQYERGSKENPFMEGWGHSDYQTDILMALNAGVKKLLITHHEPKMDDNYHNSLESKAKEYASVRSSKLEVALAKEGDIIIL